MPVVIDLTCSCGEPHACTFHAAVRVKSAECRCGCPGYAPGDAWLRPHWWLFRVLRSADRLGKCLAEFGENVVQGKCLCGACEEYISDLDGAVAVAKREMGEDALPLPGDAKESIRCSLCKLPIAGKVHFQGGQRTHPVHKGCLIEIKRAKDGGI